MNPSTQYCSVFRADGLPLVANVEWRSNPWRRARGLIGAAALGADHGLVLAPCRAIHTAFMRFPLDAIFFSRAGRVVRIAARVRPFSIIWGKWDVWGVLEMQSGWFPWANLKENDRLVFRSKAEAPTEKRRDAPPDPGPPEKTASLTPPVQ